MMTAGRIDAHIHLYDGGRPQGVPWPPAESPLPRTVLVEHWRQQARRYAVEAAVVVEASHWPASEAGGSYGDALALVEPFFQKRGSKAEERYFRTNVQSIYGLNPGRMGS